MKSSIGIFLQLTVKDKKGKILRQTPMMRSKSFVKQFLQILEAQMTPTMSVLLVKDVGNVERTVIDNVNNLALQASVGDATLGILVGTGITAVTNLDYVMETLIAHGGGANQLNYGVQSKTTTTEVGANIDLILTRTFTNDSGGTINVTESGIYQWGYVAAESDFMTAHDVFAVVAVANLEVLTVTYTIRTTV